MKTFYATPYWETEETVRATSVLTHAMVSVAAQLVGVTTPCPELHIGFIAWQIMAQGENYNVSMNPVRVGVFPVVIIEQPKRFRWEDGKYVEVPLDVPFYNSAPYEMAHLVDNGKVVCAMIFRRMLMGITCCCDDRKEVE